MELTYPSIKTKHLRRAKNVDDYLLYKAALEWGLVEPIVIDDRSDIRSENKWLDLVEPYHHQVTNLITFCRRLPVTLLADDVGLGKTISAGLIVSELIIRNRISKVLIVCPKILMPQWEEELAVKFGIKSICVIGNELVNLEYPEGTNAVITTYQSARLRFNDIEKIGFDMLILDEAHKLRNLYGVEQPPQVALRFRKALADRLFKYVLMLTATPIQNRLWDLYSLVDLLTVARGHENPFGSQGMFARKFIADSRTQARYLKSEMKDEFRSIVYGYMSRVRRGDANLHFPERVVQLHKTEPTPYEIELINEVANQINNLNILTQIMILQAVVSSPEALVSIINNMARKDTIDIGFAQKIRNVASRIKITAKLRGLETLINKLKDEQPENWRIVIFTRWRETQTTIENFLYEKGLSYCLINGDTGSQNQNNIKKFKNNPPEINVIVSTEAGSEGVNLQAANVLVNYDLPWNPMIVEQRIGRIQRLASEHASVCIFNIILQGTFEEYIVGRLMEKLQMASHAIGDIEALLESTGLDDTDDGADGFEEKIRKLVLASLEGKNIEKATRIAEQSIADAKKKLEQEEGNINALLGGAEPDLGPQCPQLPDTVRSMDVRSFVISALTKFGAQLTQQPHGALLSILDGRTELIRFDNENSGLTSILYAQGTPAFERLVSKITNSNLHNVIDEDLNPIELSEEIACKWVNSFNATFQQISVVESFRCFEGVALLRVRVNVAHDSYERLVEIECIPSDHVCIYKNGHEPILEYSNDPSNFGVVLDKLQLKAMQDPGISEFCRFYIERKTHEIMSAGNNERKRKKLEDDFTPRIEISLVGLEGKVRKILRINTNYSFDIGPQYTSIIEICPSIQKILKSPQLEKCAQTDLAVPKDCLSKCEITGNHFLKHFLAKSDISNRLALPEYIVICSLSGKNVLKDEVSVSAVSGELVISSLLKTSHLSGKKAEPKYFAKCDFTGVELLEDELMISQISNKKFRKDEIRTSTISGKSGHVSEFILCSLTKQSLLESESEKCEFTGKVVIPGLLEKCNVSGLRVIPSELEKSDLSGGNALKKYFVCSNISNLRFFENEGIRSAKGHYCSPSESKLCNWNGQKYHPEDLVTCELTGLQFYYDNITTSGYKSLEPLNVLLNGIYRYTEMSEYWDDISLKASQLLGINNCKVEFAKLSPNGNCLAVTLEVKTWGGLKTRQAGLIFTNGNIIGKVVLGKRENNLWVKNKK